MRKVVLYTLASLDGAVDDPRRYFPGTDVDVPGAPVFDEVMIDLEARMISEQDAVLLGRNMYDEWSGYWPTSDEQPFADFINGVKKYVVTSRPLTKVWGDSEAVTGPIAEFLSVLRARSGADIGVHGSIELAQSLLAAGLVDELQLVLGPVLDPNGRRLFQLGEQWTPLQLLSGTATPSGSIWLTYRFPARRSD